MHVATSIHRRLPVALAVIALIAVAGAVSSFAAPQDEGPPWANDLTAQVTQLNTQVAELNTTASALATTVAHLDDQTAQLSTKLDGLQAKLNQVDSRTVDISTDIQLLKQLANSTHDRLTAVCRNVDAAWSLLEAHAIPDIVVHIGVPENCWRNYYDPGYAATFSSRWTDPIP